MSMQGTASLYGKLKISGRLTLLTGTHIGASSEFSPIGAVDSVVVRDPLTKEPILPGSSVKGKMRTLLAKAFASETGTLNSKIEDDPDTVKRLFGSHRPEIRPARLQFFDLRMNPDNKAMLKNADTDLYLSEIKFENTINRQTAMAMPRQIERVPAGSVFDFHIMYSVENMDEVKEDVEHIASAMALLQTDYIGGHGSRGYGKLAISQIDLKVIDTMKRLEGQLDVESLKSVLKGVEDYAALAY